MPRPSAEEAIRRRLEQVAGMVEQNGGDASSLRNGTTANAAAKVLQMRDQALAQARAGGLPNPAANNPELRRNAEEMASRAMKQAGMAGADVEHAMQGAREIVGGRGRSPTSSDPADIAMRAMRKSGASDEQIEFARKQAAEILGADSRAGMQALTAKIIDGRGHENPRADHRNAPR